MFPGIDEYDVSVDVAEGDVERLLDASPADVDAAPELTFSRNIFLPLTTACRYTCTYCTYYDVPGEASLLSPEEVRRRLRVGADAGCTEALFTFGDEPDERYEEVHAQLAEWGYDDILDYLRDVCEMAMAEGLLAHSNPGDLTAAEFESLAPVNASMGVMLETTADVRAHSGTRRKTPGQRLNTIEAAGEVGVPFTTGILVGIGETWRDRAESLLAIRELHERYGHVQEVIVQNVVPNERSDFEKPSVETMRRVVAMARVALPEEVSVQVPPNLSPTRELLDCGVDDLGGVSPVTDDYINPDYEWPALRELRDIADGAGVPLYERLPVYDRYLPEAHRREDFDGRPAPGEWLSPAVRDAIGADDVHGERYRGVARRDGPLAVGADD
ncbi:7,8-didemethyl-8-hydroxy-5-deazariboflavin synthase subunit CofG [Halopelagius longus]|uniref:7,8-didemethyl-8-hydroxy-5-deazariboflavin synthase n=1 Tax=Halopelagius longus TaxID=1236180 RepID=A0A1H0Y3H6_9EURY|nr:7,8-didemethyl-8-hydroxy-5-deazariboflavin synthase subunit CofG [Halopelagius longus]RDI72252.1 7,8-didemethyl-8-hydroxy-5-deazariboflavin synthase subunit CofG [Halopelagius longus]SDQ09621.1 FO synthase subunit 1 [Halopelagius longus]